MYFSQTPEHGQTNTIFNHFASGDFYSLTGAVANTFALLLSCTIHLNNSVGDSSIRQFTEARGMGVPTLL